MATFEAKVYKLIIEEHPNADAIEIARVGDYVSIVKKGDFKTGDLGVYIQEASIVPDLALKRMGLWNDEKDVGMLAGKKGNRVKAIKLRGVLSQGLIYPVEFIPNCVESGGDTYPIPMKDIYCVTMDEGGAGHVVKEGYDVSKWMYITKYEPVIPTSMNGEVFNAFGMTVKFDIENIKKFPDIITEGEEVTLTEKLHGTWCCFGFHPDSDIPIVTSKGLSDKGLAFKFNEANENNLYVKMFHQLTNDTGKTILENFIKANDYCDWGGWESCGNKPFYILGEIFGSGVQDLTYGDAPKQFRVFDIYVGEPGKGRYVNTMRVKDICNDMRIETVPFLYKGPFNKDVLVEHTNGKETASGTEAHMREGVVIRPLEERRHDEIGRVILKSVSEKYILRKNATEFT